MRRLAVLLVGCILLMGTLPAFSAPLFKDLPEKHWALDALKDLAAKGIVEGYPDGTFKGDRAATRWEVAMILARLLARCEQEHTTFATKADYETVMALAKAYKDELAAYGVRVAAVEEAYGKLDSRTTALERITFYGNLDTILAAQSIGGSLANVGDAANPGIDWTSGRLLTHGRVITALLNLGVKAKVSDELDAELTLASFTAQGDPMMELYWGVSAPYLSNAFTVSTTSPLLTNSPWTRVSLDKFSLVHRTTDLHVNIGSFRPARLDPAICYGARNPNYHGPAILPFYGARVMGSFTNAKYPITYEAMYSRLAQASAYNTWFGAANMEFDFPLGTTKGRLALNFLKAGNVDNSQGVIVGTGAVALPAAIIASGGWYDARNKVLRVSVGPQDQTTVGAGVTLDFPNQWQLILDYASSNYNPDTRKLPAVGFDTTTSGSMYRVAVSAKIKAFDGLLEYVKTEGTYDPFMLPFSTPAGIPVFLPYSTYYSNYYQLHDYITYPNNRQGLRFTGNYRFTDRTVLSVNFGDVEQVNASTPTSMQLPGFIEPLFGQLALGGNEKGRVTSWGIGLDHQFPSGLRAYAGYFNYVQRRASTGVDDINLKENLYNVNLGYPFSAKFSVFAGYTWLDFSGNSVGVNTNFNQNVPTIGMAYMPDPDSSVYVTYKLFDFHNIAVANSDYRAYQTLMEYRIKF